jgi:MurNAc alpha-1-phosphate uridylyltransferase
MLPIAILAGGLATRLRPLTTTIPKSMIEILGQPFVHWQLRLLAQQGFREVVFCLAYKSEIICDFVGDGTKYGLKVSYSYDGDQQLGTGGAINKALPLLGKRFMVLYGDSYLPVDFRLIEDVFNQSRMPGLMTVFQNDGEFDASNVVFSDGYVRRYAKGEVSKDMRYVDYGLSCFESSAFHPVHKNVPLDLGQICSELATQGLMAGYEVKERFYEIGSFKGIQDFREYVERYQNVL